MLKAYSATIHAREPGAGGQRHALTLDTIHAASEFHAKHEAIRRARNAGCKIIMSVDVEEIGHGAVVA